ncbi:hypothetical protein DPMN_036743 [Dreissena polymorpha]|uniref:Uncharacterized protein n=1 Tax=Dreissena polymorpha TaxID=45954 RepID=A0A9D4ME35_DREPO|nr:hypothetical protein DPMN_036743 [Dreissena polymorpha]
MVQLEEKMTAYMVQMDSIMAGSIPLEMQNGSMKAMYERASNMVTDMMSSSSWSTMAEWMDIFQTAGTMKDVLVTSSDLQWTWSKVEQGYVITTGLCSLYK